MTIFHGNPYNTWNLWAITQQLDHRETIYTRMWNSFFHDYVFLGFHLKKLLVFFGFFCFCLFVCFVLFSFFVSFSFWMNIRIIFSFEETSFTDEYKKSFSVEKISILGLNIKTSFFKEIEFSDEYKTLYILRNFFFIWRNYFF